MPVKVKSVEALRGYFRGVADRAQHHAPKVDLVIYPLLGFILLNMDDETDIEVRGTGDAIGNILWVPIRGTRYAFCYNHEKWVIEIRKGSFRGDTLCEMNNNTTIGDIAKFFESL